MSNTRDIHRGKDGWLFPIGGSNDTSRYCANSDAFTDAVLPGGYGCCMTGEDAVVNPEPATRA